MLIDTLFHASIFREIRSPLTDDGRTGRSGVAGGAQGGGGGLPQTLGKKNEGSHHADSPIPQSGPLASTEFLHGYRVGGTTHKQTGAHCEARGRPA